MGILRDTYQKCMKVKQILRTLLVKFEERDVFMSTEYQAEIQERMRSDHVLVPQVFVDGQHIGVSNNYNNNYKNIQDSPISCSLCENLKNVKAIPQKDFIWDVRMPNM